MSGDPLGGAARAQSAHESRTRSQVRLAIIAAVVGVLVLVVFGLVGIAIGATGMVVFAVLFAAACGVAAWSTYRKARPSELPAQVRVEPPEAVRGGRVRVLVEPSSGQGLGAMEVELICLERYAVQERHDGDWVRRTREAREIELRQTIGSGGGVVDFDIPATAPYSHDGTVLAYEWRVETTLPRRRRLDARRVVPVWVRP